MKVIEHGHIYLLQSYDGPSSDVWLQHTKRVGPGYPGNEGRAHAGTNCQEVLRAEIDRIQYLDGQEACPQNKAILHHLRSALHLLEFRAAERKGKLREYHMMPGFRPDLVHLEKLVPCKTCGHVFPHNHADEKENSGG